MCRHVCDGSVHAFVRERNNETGISVCNQASRKSDWTDTLGSAMFKVAVAESSVVSAVFVVVVAVVVAECWSDGGAWSSMETAVAEDVDEVSSTVTGSGQSMGSNSGKPLGFSEDSGRCCKPPPSSHSRGSSERPSKLGGRYLIVRRRRLEEHAFGGPIRETSRRLH